jgi:cell division septum initiation protein DivIVA
MSDLDKHNPQFTISIRGYDRLQVDDYIHRLQRLVAEAEERARAAESDLEFSRHTTVGPRVTEILELAVAESKELRDRVRQETDALIQEAQLQADHVLREGRLEAEELAERSRTDHQVLVGELTAERERRQTEVAELEDRKAALLAELRRLHNALGSVADLALEAGSPVIDADGIELETIPMTQLPRADADSAAA